MHVVIDTIAICACQKTLTPNQVLGELARKNPGIPIIRVPDALNGNEQLAHARAAIAVRKTEGRRHSSAELV